MKTAELNGYPRSQRLLHHPYVLMAVLILLISLMAVLILIIYDMRDELRRMSNHQAFFHSIAARDIFEVKPGPELAIVADAIANHRVPIVITDGRGNPQQWRNIGVPAEDRTPETLREVKEIAKHLDLQNPPLTVEIPPLALVGESPTQVIHSGESRLVGRLFWLPFVMLCTSILVGAMGYLFGRIPRERVQMG